MCCPVIWLPWLWAVTDIWDGEFWILLHFLDWASLKGLHGLRCCWKLETTLVLMVHAAARAMLIFMVCVTIGHHACVHDLWPLLSAKRKEKKQYREEAIKESLKIVIGMMKYIALQSSRSRGGGRPLVSLRAWPLLAWSCSVSGSILFVFLFSCLWGGHKGGRVDLGGMGRKCDQDALCEILK
jgi:hypothetical protein